MKSWLIRALFAGVLLGVLAIRIQASQAPDELHDERPAVAALLASQGITARIVPTEQYVLLKAVTFEARQCSGHIDVFPVRLNLQEAPLFDAAVGAGRDQHIAYLGRTWHEPNRLELRIEWLKHKALSVSGLGSYTANTTALLIAAPKGCDIARSIDWSAFWHRAPAKG